jgi:hypothetical protein
MVASEVRASLWVELTLDQVLGMRKATGIAALLAVG